MKKLVENMISDYLEESYEDDIVESIFEEVSDETWEDIEEAILSELSPGTLKKYIGKAGANQTSRQLDIAWDNDHRDQKYYRDTMPGERSGRSDIRKRSTGIKRAKRSLSKMITNK